MFFGKCILLSTRDCAQKRNHHSHHEPRMKQYIDWSRRDQGRPQPSSSATSQAEPLSGLRSFSDHAHSLHEKICRWQSVGRSSRNGNDQIVQEPWSEKCTERAGSSTETLLQRLEH